MNDFGAYIGGPISLPRLYNGHDKTFFFADYEGLRLPQTTTVTETVPTTDMRAGNICAYLDTVDRVSPGNEPKLFTPSGTQIPCNAVPVSPIAANVMKAVSNSSTMGPHADDPRMDALWHRCGQLGLPVNIHVSDPIWSYQPMDKFNDGLMNGWTWRIDLQPGMYDHDQLVTSLEKSAQAHPKTIFIACHLANLDYDLTRLGQTFERNPNLFADISGRFAETAAIPRFVHQFLSKYSDRVLYGTDMAYSQRMFSTTFRILESNDEHSTSRI